MNLDLWLAYFTVPRYCQKLSLNKTLKMGLLFMNMSLPWKVMLLSHHQECSIDQTCTHVNYGDKCSILLRNFGPILAKRIPSESPSTTKMEYKQTKFQVGDVVLLKKDIGRSKWPITQMLQNLIHVV